MPVQRDNDDLVAASPMGEVRVRFVPRHEYGVLDHRDCRMVAADLARLGQLLESEQRHLEVVPQHGDAG